MEIKMTINKERIKLILSSVLNCPIEDITDEIPLTEIGLDSIKFISTIVDIESTYNIEILDSDLLLDNFKNILSICDTLEKYSDGNLKLYKCVITDCDGVLWHGISGESGDDKAFSDNDTNTFCKILHDLRKRGVLLAICSKNELQNIEAMFDNTSMSFDDFALIEANTINKADSVSYILNEFGFSSDNAIFIDDDDAELEYVKNKIPALTVIKATNKDDFAKNISNMFSYLDESNAIDRTAQYREQKEREKIHHHTSSSKEYNQILETKTVCGKATSQDAFRLAELSQRANRFNLSGVKYTETDIENMMLSKGYSIYKLCAKDKFGDMGLVALSVIRDNIIESFIMSCRVFGRDFETELLKKIQLEFGNNLKGVYHQTGKNEYCRNFYEEHGVTYELC